MYNNCNYTYLHYKIEHTVCGAKVVATKWQRMTEKIIKECLYNVND
jgi:hypothetical protein